MAAASGATGDIKNNLTKLLREVQRMKLRVEPDIRGLSLGAPSALLPILHQSLMHYSLPLASWLSKHDYELYGKNDLRFVEGVYKVLREVFHYHPRLTKEQFLTVGYAERKLLLVTDLLRGCQRKHCSLTQRNSGRGGGGGGGRGRKYKVHGSADLKSEVLTIQSTSGISSAWTEPLVTQVQGPEEEEVAASLSSPDHTPPPHPFTPSHMLELTPSPPPPLPLPSLSSPTAHKSQPLIVRHDPEEERRSVGVPSGWKFQLGGPLSSNFGPPVEKLVIDNLSSVSSASEGVIGDVREERESEGGNGNFSHRGNPQDEGEREESRPPAAKGNDPPSEQVVLSEVSERVQQLVGMMEKMSARFVLIETQLKTMQAVRGKKRGKDGEGEGSEFQSEHTMTGEGGKRKGENYSHCRSREEEVISTAIRATQTATTVGVAETTKSTDTMTDVSVSTARAALANISNEPPPGRHGGSEFVKPGVPLQSDHPHTSTPHSRHTSTQAVRRLGGSGGVLSSQIALIREEVLSPLPTLSSQPHPHIPLHHTSSHPHPHTPSHPHSHTPSQPHSHTSSHPHSHTPSPPPSQHTPHTLQLSKLSVHSSSSPDDTTSMIASLRERAQRTKDFLQNANNRP